MSKTRIINIPTKIKDLDMDAFYDDDSYDRDFAKFNSFNRKKFREELYS